MSRSSSSVFLVAIAVGTAMLLGPIAAEAFSQESNSATAATTESSADTESIAGNSTTEIHHHHYHHYPPHWWGAPMYPNPYPYRVPGMPYPMSYRPFVPTPAQPYPSWYVPGQNTPMPFPNTTADNAELSEGIIHVFVPNADAEVFLNGQKMRGSGKDRRFVTPPLEPNRTYQYFVTARLKRGDEPVTEYRKIFLDAGGYNVADFTRPAKTSPFEKPMDTPVRFTAGPVNQNDVVHDEEEAVE